MHDFYVAQIQTFKILVKIEQMDGLVKVRKTMY